MVLKKSNTSYTCGRSTIDLIFTVLKLERLTVRLWKGFVMAFLDMEKVYDSVNRNILWELLRKKV